VGDVDSAFGEQLFDISEAQRETKIEPDSPSYSRQKRN